LNRPKKAKGKREQKRGKEKKRKKKDQKRDGKKNIIHYCARRVDPTRGEG
jgi:hypothetical protein